MLAVLERRYLALCAPAQLYMALGALGAIGSAFQSPTGAIAGLGLTVAWSAMVNLVCQSGYQTLAWGLVFAPSLLLAALLVTGIVFLATLPRHGKLREGADFEDRMDLEDPVTYEKPAGGVGGMRWG